MEKMWSKTDLQELTELAYYADWSKAERLNYCKAWYLFTGGGEVAFLKSYDTIVAVYNRRVGTLYVFEHYSHTTTQHVWKFARMLDVARITWLYRRSDNVVETHYGIPLPKTRLTVKQARDLENNDYRGYITSKWST